MCIYVQWGVHHRKASAEKKNVRQSGGAVGWHDAAAEEGESAEVAKQLERRNQINTFNVRRKYLPLATFHSATRSLSAHIPAETSLSKQPVHADAQTSKQI